MSRGGKLAKLADHELMEKYVEYNVAARLAMESLDVTVHNEYMDRILEIDAELIRRGGQAWKVMTPLLQHRDPQVRLSAAAFLLRFDVESAVPVLQALDPEPPEPSESTTMIPGVWLKCLTVTVA